MEVISDLKISTEEDVYRPDDDSYLLLSLMKVNKGDRILEIGCGSGIISIHSAMVGGEVTSMDINESAVRQTRYNAEQNGVVLKNILVGDMFNPVKGEWDVIVFNPPYLPNIEEQKPDVRWDGGIKGDETILRFLEDGRRFMHKGSRLYFCCSDMSPLEKIHRILARYYAVNDKKEKRYQFESLYAYELLKQQI